MLTKNDLYPTRGTQERLTERKDPILYGLDYLRKKLTEPEVLHYEHNGFVIIPDVFTDSEITNFKRNVKRLKQFNNQEKNRYWRRNVPTGEDGSLFAPERESTIFYNLARDRRILDRVQHVLGGPVYLHRSRIHIEDGSRETAYPWHSEFETWHAEDGIPRMRGVEAWIMLTESTPTNGAFRMLAKSHYIYVACQAAGTPEAHGDDAPVHQPSARPGIETLTRLLYFGQLAEACGKPGTLVLCDGNLMYGSSRNTGMRPRMTAMFSYNSVENLPAERPFAGGQPRPSPVVNHDLTALQPRNFDFTDAEFSSVPEESRESSRQRRERTNAMA